MRHSLEDLLDYPSLMQQGFPGMAKGISLLLFLFVVGKKILLKFKFSYIYIVSSNPSFLQQNFISRIYLKIQIYLHLKLSAIFMKYF